MNGKEYLTSEELYLFNQGKYYNSYLKFGAHKGKMDHDWGVHFSVWAPQARRVNVVGSFNNWCGVSHGMEKLSSTGVWTLFVPHLAEGALYKYEIETPTGEIMLKADPFAFYAEKRPATASIVYSLDGYGWGDQAWRQRKNEYPYRQKPMLIYEVHLGSWKRKPDNAFLSYRETAEQLVSYMLDMGFTHLELLPIMEHPYDGSWGYQVTGYYAATSRYGTPHEFMYLIDKCHQAGIGVILDWVPGHFCKDSHGLGRFDGTKLLESHEHKEWGTYKFDFSRTEGWSFLISNALFWFDRFHIDGLRVDGVTSMLLLNYGREDGEWTPNIYGGRENLEAIAFLRQLNEVVFQNYPDALMIAEESTDWPFVTKPPCEGGLGFNYKWNMGWMNDTLKYTRIPFTDRTDHHALLTFSLVFAFNENFILPLSHDEVVHGKRSLIGRMPGDYWQKFAGLRAAYLYLICHPGKKLLFMGGEFAQFMEWRYDSPLEWFLLDYEMHHKYQDYVRSVNHLYCQEESLWLNDHDWSGFEWINADNHRQSILIFLRKSGENKNFIIVVINLRPIYYESYRVGIPNCGRYREMFNTDTVKFGGSGQTNPEWIEAEEVPWQGRAYSICIKIPPLGGVIIKPEPEYPLIC